MYRQRKLDLQFQCMFNSYSGTMYMYRLLSNIINIKIAILGRVIPVHTLYIPVPCNLEYEYLKIISVFIFPVLLFSYTSKQVLQYKK